MVLPHATPACHSRLTYIHKCPTYTETESFQAVLWRLTILYSRNCNKIKTSLEGIPKN